MAGEYQVLKITSSGPTGFDITEISLDGVPLLDVVSLKLEISADDFTRATLVLDVVPAVDVVAAAERQ
jgi:hypothetical protein